MNPALSGLRPSFLLRCRRYAAPRRRVRFFVRTKKRKACFCAKPQKRRAAPAARKKREERRKKKKRRRRRRKKAGAAWGRHRHRKVGHRSQRGLRPQPAARSGQLRLRGRRPCGLRSSCVSARPAQPYGETVAQGTNHYARQTCRFLLAVRRNSGLIVQVTG